MADGELCRLGSPGSFLGSGERWSERRAGGGGVAYRDKGIYSSLFVLVLQQAEMNGRTIGTVICFASTGMKQGIIVREV